MNTAENDSLYTFNMISGDTQNSNLFFSKYYKKTDFKFEIQKGYSNDFKKISKYNYDDFKDEFIIQTAQHMNLILQYIDGSTRVLADGEDISDKLRAPAVNKIVSQVAKLGPVREKMVALQRAMASSVDGSML